MTKHLIDERELSKQDINAIFKETQKLYKKHTTDLKNKNLAMIFFKPSTRTRLSFEVAMNQLGGNSIYFSHNDSQISRGETLADTARILSQYVDGAVLRVFKHSNLVEIAKHSTIPIINGLSDLLHPCQALSDAFTIKQHFGKLDGIKIAFIGDGTSNVCHSLIGIAGKLGMEMRVACPNAFKPLVRGKYAVYTDPFKAAHHADVIYTDTWVSMGQEHLYNVHKKIKMLKHYQISERIMKTAKRDAVFMHCLPAHRGHEVTNEVIDSKQSVVLKQAANRLHVQKAILKLLLK